MTHICTPTPELVCPAGDMEALRAAVANGADAVYFGLPRFNARQRATNFPLEELPATLQYLHDRNVRGYITFNTLIFSEELPAAAEMVRALAEAGADAVVVQDFGLVSLIRRMAPGLRIHASTQMTLSEPEGIRLVRELGIQRVILPRETSLAEIRRIREQTDTEMEVFVHGALCISYSGQCLASESLGGRSANRGLCAQPCRMEYRLKVDGRAAELGDRRYLLSPLDLAAHGCIAELVRLGVAGFKIEGRLKSAPYVAITAQVYRAAIDAAVAGRPFVISDEQRQALSQSFSRGFTEGYLSGPRHAPIVEGLSPRNRGVRVGEVVGKSVRSLIVRTEGDAFLRAGDGLLFSGGPEEEKEQGGRVFAIGKSRHDREGTTELLFREGDLDLSAVAVGATVWKTADPALQKRLEQSYARDAAPRRSPLALEVRASIGSPLQVALTDEAGRRAEATWDRPLEAAVKHPLTVETLRDQFGRLGDTPFTLGPVKADPLDPVMVPKSVLNDLRRQAVERLMELRREAARHTVTEPDALEQLRAELRPTAPPPARDGKPNLHFLVRSFEQLDACIEAAKEEQFGDASTAYLDFRSPADQLEALRRTRAAGRRAGLVTLRIIKPGQEESVAALARMAPDAILVRNVAGLILLRRLNPEIALIGDFSLNISNELAAARFAALGLTRLTPSYDLTWREFAPLIERAPANWFEVVVHQHMPMFHTEHCLLRSNLGLTAGPARQGQEPVILSEAKDLIPEAPTANQGYEMLRSAQHDSHGCLRHCAGHRIAVEDRLAAEHPVLTDAACRNTVYNAQPQSACECVPEMLQRGLRHFRMEFLREDVAATHVIIGIYARLLRGELAGKAAWREVQKATGHRATRGTTIAGGPEVAGAYR